MILQVVGSPDFWKLQQNGRKLHKGLKSDVKTAPQTNPVCPYGGMVTHKTWVMTVQWPRNLAAFFGRATNAAIYLHLHLATSGWDVPSNLSLSATEVESRFFYFSSWPEPVRVMKEDDFLHSKTHTFHETNISHLKINGWNTSSFPFWGPTRPIFKGCLTLLGCPAGT